MKKIFIKILASLISSIETYEDYQYGYHIDLDQGIKKIGNLKLR